MEPLMDRVDVLVGNEEDTERVFASGKRIRRRRRWVEADGYAQPPRLIRRSRFRYVATTLRGDRRQQLGSDLGRPWASRVYEIEQISIGSAR
jgi:hypothetical protein